MEPPPTGTGGRQYHPRTFQRWVELAVLERIWDVLVQECEELGGVDWEWQAAVVLLLPSDYVTLNEKRKLSRAAG